MNVLELDLVHMRNDDMWVVVPQRMFPGEPGQPFGTEGIEFLLGLARMGYWPVDFGEGTATHLSLWMQKGESIGHAMILTTNFINKGGDV